MRWRQDSLLGGRVSDAGARRAPHTHFAERHVDASPYAIPASSCARSTRPASTTSLPPLGRSLDLFFIDADKEHNHNCYEAVLPKLAPHGLIVADNTLRRGTVLDPDDDIAQLDALNAAWAAAIPAWSPCR